MPCCHTELGIYIKKLKEKVRNNVIDQESRKREVLRSYLFSCFFSLLSFSFINSQLRLVQEVYQYIYRMFHYFCPTWCFLYKKGPGNTFHISYVLNFWGPKLWTTHKSNNFGASSRLSLHVIFLDSIIPSTRTCITIWEIKV